MPGNKTAKQKKAKGFSAVYGFLLIISFCVILFFSSPIYAQTYVLLNDTYSSVNLSFTSSVTSHDFYVTLPRGNVDSASIKLSGVAVESVENVFADVMIVTDVSGSMSSTKIQSAKEADYLFVNTIDTNYIQIGLVKYSSCPTVLLDVLPITSNKQLLNNTIAGYTAGGTTNIGKGLMLAIDELDFHARTNNMNILLMTDGQANQYYVDSTGRCYADSYPYNRAKQYTLDMAAWASALGIKVYAIGFGSDADMALLDEVAEITGGESYFAPTGDDLKNLYESIAKKIANSSYITPEIGNGLWSSNEEFYGDATWTDSDCGWMGADCVNFRDWLQQQLDECADTYCRVNFTISSPTAGDLIVSDLYITTSPRGSITCEQNTPSYLLQPGTELNIPLEDVFVFDGDVGTTINIQAINSTGVLLEKDLPERFNATYDGLTETKTLYLRISTDQSITSSICPVVFSPDAALFGTITCKYPAPQYSLSSSARIIPLMNIFEFHGDTGEPATLFVDSAEDVLITPDFPNNIIVQREETALSEIAKVRIRTDRGVYSPSCSIRLISIDSNCGQDACLPFLNAGDIQGLMNNGCTDGQIRVINPSWVSVHDIYPELSILEKYTVNSFTAINAVPSVGGNFEIDPVSGNKFTVFSVSGVNVPDSAVGIGVIKFYIDAPGEVYTYCPVLVRTSFEPDLAVDVETDLLVTGSRPVIGYRDQFGKIIGQGPFIFTAKVWLRK